jgi:hypothetical protein
VGLRNTAIEKLSDHVTPVTLCLAFTIWCAALEVRLFLKFQASGWRAGASCLA